MQQAGRKREHLEASSNAAATARASCDSNRGAGNPDWSPIDHIFQFHRALQRESEALELAAA